MKNVLCDMINIEFPLVGFSHCRDVVAAVSKAGGLGVLGAVAFSPRQLEIELTWIEEHVGGRPFGVDVLVPTKYEGASEGGLNRQALNERIPEEYRRFVDELLTSHGVPTIEEGRGRTNALDQNISASGASDLLDVCFAHDVGLVANALGPPPQRMLDDAHSRGIPVAALVGTRAHALRQQESGVDLVVAQGYEAGGHTGEIASMVLVPEVVDAVSPLPVLAAGGIGSGRQMAAAMALGAVGVWTGSVWLATEEAETHPVVKQKFLRASSSDTVRSRATTGKPARQLRTDWTDAWGGEGQLQPLPMPLQPALVNGPLRRIARAAMVPGSEAADLVTYFVGQVVGSMDSIKPARRVFMDIIEEWIAVTSERFEDLSGDSPQPAVR